MKSILKTSILCALILSVGAISAQARGGHQHNDEALAALGGFIGGVILSESLHDHHRETVHVRYENRKQCDTGWREGHYQNSGWRDKGHNRCRGNCGHWKTVKRRVYVPVSYTWTYDSCGAKIRTRTGGYFKTVCERIWIGKNCGKCRG
ncbi:hypothetical protein [Cerasicoccus fimbriatus]|uniref:hypothetical protein n=1 Tax=Cerasicoccus fimbriatus TaxID=3014554 RepID=UPI0022B2BA23|nr:hypothetical protein [Cerasicoccus sp. TK19100]